MAEPKTKQTNADVYAFIETFANTEQKKNDSLELVKLMQEFTGCEPKMWGPSIIGFGKYRYRTEKGGQESDWPLLGFSPRKAAISLYVWSGEKENEHLVEALGKITVGKACIYVKKLSDIDLEQLKKLMAASIEYTRKKYTIY